MKQLLSILIIIVYSVINGIYAQSNIEEIRLQLLEMNSKTSELQGLVLDKNKLEALPFTSIVFLHKHKGTISNEDGYFTVNSTLLNIEDTISVQFMGYKSIKITLADFKNNPIIYLEENIFSINDIFVFGTQPDAKDIIEKVIEHKDENYKNITTKTKSFIRQRNTYDLKNFTLKFKKSTFETINKKLNKLIEDKMPKHTSSFSDFLGFIYQNRQANDSINIKIEPIQLVVLQGEEIDMSKLESVFKKLFKNTKEKEYWKIKSGILSRKLEIVDNDSTKLKDNEIYTGIYQHNIENSYNFLTFKDQNQWEFLYKTGRYKYTIAGGTVVNGEEVYIIDFIPNGSGIYQGRVYVSIATSAIIRADYEYTLGKCGTNIHILGVAYNENKFKASIYFEKKRNSYRLKYFSLKKGVVVGINRNLSLIKKKERFFFDKKLYEYKVKLKLKQNTEQYIEMLVINEQIITKKHYDSYSQKEKMQVINVKQFDDNLWNNFTIITPTKQMKDYRKLE